MRWSLKQIHFPTIIRHCHQTHGNALVYYVEYSLRVTLNRIGWPKQLSITSPILIIVSMNSLHCHILTSPKNATYYYCNTSVHDIDRLAALWTCCIYTWVCVKVNSSVKTKSEKFPMDIHKGPLFLSYIHQYKINLSA